MKTGKTRCLLVLMALLSGCTRPSTSTGTGKVEDERERVKQASTEALVCPEELVGKNPRPQAPNYRGRCLEVAVYFKKDSQREGIYTAHNTTGAQLGRVKVVDTGVDHTILGGQRVRLHDVTTVDGAQSYCASESYDATPEEVREHCPGGLAGCEYYERMKGRALLVPGYWTQTAWHPSETEFSISCISGVIAKCIHWGYQPGALHQGDPNKPLTPYFKACLHAARARYDSSPDQDHAYTCAGTKIDIYDNLGLQTKDVGSLAFESLWDENGLVCLKRPRYQHCTTLTLSPSCADPVAEVGRSWSGGQGLIGVSSAIDNNLGACPHPADLQRQICPR